MPKINVLHLKKLKSKLPFGSIAKIAKQLNLSIGHVSNILNNKKVDNHGVLLLAAKMAKQNQNEIFNMKLKAEQIIKSL
jgi:hypothetical protein